MLSDFINSNTEPKVAIATEGLAEMAIFLGEDPAIALEGDESGKNLLGRLKARISAITEKIKAFIQKVLSWMKTKLFNLFKVDSITIDQLLWNNISKSLNEFDKIKLKLKDSFKMGIFLGKHANKSFTDETQKQLDELKAITDGYTKRYDEIVASSEYKDAVGGKTSGNNTIIRTASLTNMKQKIARDLEILNDGIKGISATISMNDTNEFAIYNACLTEYMNVLNCRIMALNKEMVLLNIVIDRGLRSNPKI